ncbi:hypothetical protein GQ43DRAFT_484866 [Delitschia confertaspora ATCC 74209]|uniref:DUF4139 domain-containing protein n=1 Tax=Delitschia confertaspora ATCC 74209 TaxID=1513339 RepID=A0A9P4JH10_9PLEO|nr:hypothetical protein GQ43DRAFT_484866 [Delitschia confertaspora ATCC 74209]
MFGAPPVPETTTSMFSNSSDLPKQVYNLKDLSTTSVTLYPTWAHVTRDIQDIALAPGANEVEIYGLSPSVDEHSIQIEGKGFATIADMTVELVPNLEIFEGVHPEEESEANDDEDDGQGSEEDTAVRGLEDEIKELQFKVTQLTEEQNSATVRLAFLDKYARSVSAEHNSPDDMTKLLQKYQEDRADIFVAHSAASRDLAELKEEIKEKEKAKEKSRGSGKKEGPAPRLEKNKQAEYVKRERLRYWPKKVYKVIVLLETPSVETPSASCRGSTDSVTLAHSPRSEVSRTTAELGKPVASTASEKTTVSLTLSYVTREAGWSPRYDVKISSTTETATIIYRTEFLNRTSETWKDAKLAFSTSQTSYQGLDDVIPEMHVWRVKLSKSDVADQGLLSRE